MYLKLFFLKTRPAFLLKHDFSPGFDLVSHETTKVLSAIFTHETRSAEKNVSTFFLGEKLCLKFCTVINNVIENRFLL
jgi:hypothetical protein